MKTKLTAVEWLFIQITQNQEIRYRGTRYVELFEQAKQIEKEQIVNAWDDCMTGEIFELKQEDSGELYYENVYGR